MFICGNDDGAKAAVKEILDEFGWGTIDIIADGVERLHHARAAGIVL